MDKVEYILYEKIDRVHKKYWLTINLKNINAKISISINKTNKIKIINNKELHNKIKKE
jgi:hypothetical protein